MKKLASILAYLVFMVSVAAGFSLVLVNWAVGCGEPIYKHDGTWETGECVVIPYETKKGTW